MLKRHKKSLVSKPTVYPDGVCVKTPSGVFLIKGQKRYRIPTRRVLDSWAFPLLIETTEEAVAHYPIVAKVGFRDGSLIYNFSDGKIYLISNNKRRQITSPDALSILGLTRSDAVSVSSYEVNLQHIGADIS